jgi:intracellular sulfur oxidation DsrE/DsrF family protein
MKYLIFLFFTFSLSAYSQRQFPEIDSFGGVFPIPEAEQLVDPNKKYKIVVDMTSAAKNPTKDTNPGFESVARLVNLYSLAGVKKENLEIAVVIHFEATPVILSDEAFQMAYKENNPNTAVIDKLAEKGVKFYVCGQSLRMRKLVEYKKNKNIRVAHGAILALTHFQSLGYSLLTLH